MSETLASRMLLLQELTTDVTQARDAAAAACAVVRLGCRLLGALSSALWLVDGEDALELVAKEGVPDDFVAKWQRVTPDDDVPAMHTLRRGEPLWVGSVDEYRSADPQIALRAEAAQRPLAFAGLPLHFERRPLGVLVFGYVAPHAFSIDEKALALAIASHAAHGLERARLEAAQSRTLAGLHLLAKVGEMVGAASLDVDATLTALACAVVPEVADWCVIDMFVHGNVRRLTAHHADPAKVALARSYAERYPSRLDGPSASFTRILAEGKPIWARRITRQMLEQTIRDPDQLAILVSLGLRSTVQVPLVSEGSVRGAVTFIMSESGREYDEIDRDLLVEIGRLASQALTNAALYAREQRARDRVTRLAAVTAELARASTTADVGEVACREGATALDASSAALYALADDKLRLIAQFNYDRAGAEEYAGIPLAEDLPVTRVVARNEPVIIESRAELRREFPAVADRFEAANGEQAFMCKPLFGRAGTVLGVLVFGFAGARTFADDERVFGRTLADHCAHAFDRARILDIERYARERLALLAAAGETLSATVDYATTLEAVVATALPTLGDFGFFEVLEENGAVRRTSAAHEDPEATAILNASRWVRSERPDLDLCDLSTGRGVLRPAIDEALLKQMARDEAHLDVLRSLSPCSMISVPVRLRGVVMGALTLYYGRSGRHHTNDDLDLAMELGRRSAIAIDQARLHLATMDAARRAEDANRIKDDFLATVSHELRTPLNAILGWAHLLDSERVSDEASVRRGLDVIRRNAQAQRVIIDDLLDIARIISGKLKIEARSVDVGTVIQDALEVVRPAAEAKRVRLESDGLGLATQVVADQARLRQVVWNLLANAVKFTSAGGSVRVCLVVAHDHVIIRVIDNGIGIDAQLLPFVFDRFRQADSSSSRAQGGLGLGLSIVRHLVELHGGTVSAASDGLGRGATFEVVLPLSRRSTSKEDPDRPASPEPDRVSNTALEGLRVLLVDDEEDSREMAGITLREAGATLQLAKDADEAISHFKHDRWDVVVSDIAMPNVDGYALLGILQRVAREQRIPLRAIALTAYGRAEDQAIATRAGFAAHLTKPVDPATLVSMVASVGRA